MSDYLPWHPACTWDAELHYLSSKQSNWTQQTQNHISMHFLSVSCPLTYQNEYWIDMDGQTGPDVKYTLICFNNIPCISEEAYSWVARSKFAGGKYLFQTKPEMLCQFQWKKMSITYPPPTWILQYELKITGKQHNP